MGKTAAEAVMSQKPYAATIDLGQQNRYKYSRELQKYSSMVVKEGPMLEPGRYRKTWCKTVK